MAERVTSQRRTFIDTMKKLGLLCLYYIALHLAGFPSTVLSRVGSSRDWSHVEKQKGWFAYAGLSSSQVCLCELMCACRM